MSKTPEGEVAKYLVHRCLELDFHQRKVSYEGRVGAPDRLVFGGGVSCWIELKAFGCTPTVEQMREHDRLRSGGMDVYVCDSKESVDTVLHKLEAKREKIRFKPKYELIMLQRGQFKPYVSVTRSSRNGRKERDE